MDQSLLKERLKFCKNCIHRKNNLKTGILCGLTDSKPDFNDSCKDYQVDIDRIKKEKERENYRIKKEYGDYADDVKSGKSSLWKKLSLGISVLLLCVKIILFLIKLGNSHTNNTHHNTHYNSNTYKPLQKANKKQFSVDLINYLSSKNRNSVFNKKLTTDTVIVLHKKIKLKLPKGFYLSVANQSSDLPIKATSRGYYFIYNKVVKNNNLSALEQWKAYRNTFIQNYPGSEIVIKSNINNKISNEDRIDFEIQNTSDSFKGSVQIIDYKNERLFFQLVSDASNANRSKINRFLDYYVNTSIQ